MTTEKTENTVVQFPAQPKEKPAKRKSALVGLRDSGLMLVPRKKSPKKGRQATKEDYAKVNFRAVKRDDKVMRMLGEGWHNHGIAVRFAYASMMFSRDGWVKFHADTDHDHVDELLASWIDTSEFLKTVVQMIECAQMRLVATGCLAHERGVLGDGKRPVMFDGFQMKPTLVSNRKLR